MKAPSRLRAWEFNRQTALGLGGAMQAGCRRPAAHIVRDVREHGSEILADTNVGVVFPTLKVPGWLMAEIRERQGDLLALFQEFDDRRSGISAAVVGAAERIALDGKCSPRRDGRPQ